MIDIEQIQSRHPVGDLLVPKNIDEMPALGFAAYQFVAPRTVYCMDYFLQAKDQGNKPWCAAYSAAGFLENILWRKDDVPQTIDPTWIYQLAKQHDGMPNVDGTSLNAVLDALLERQYFPTDRCRIKILRTVDQVKYAIHKFGCCMLGFNISKEWYYCNSKKTAIYGQSGYDTSLVGGHAVVSGGMDESGIYILNSWGEDWASYGRALITWDEVKRQFIYGAVIDNCLIDVKFQ